MQEEDPMELIRKRVVGVFMVLGALTFCLSTQAASPPGLINYQGVLRNASGAPLTGSYDMVFRFYSASSGGDQILVDTHTGGSQVGVVGGLFTTTLGGGTVTDGTGPGTYTSLATAFRDYGTVYVEIVVGGETLNQRVRVVSSAYALNADNLDGLDSASFSLTSHNHTGTYLPLAGGTMAGNIAFSGAQTVDGVDISAAASNWNSAYTHSTATSNVHGLTYTAEGTGGGLDADLLDGQHASAFMGSGADNWVNTTGDTMTGKLTTAVPALGGAGFTLPHGAAPSTPANGDLWTTTAGLFARINGSTAGPFISTSISDHGLLSGLADDDHPQYFALAQNETVTGTTTFSAASTDIRGQIVDGDSAYVTLGEDTYVSGGHLGIGVAPSTDRGLYMNLVSSGTYDLFGTFSSVECNEATASVPYVWGALLSATHLGAANDSYVYGVEGRASGNSTSTGNHYGVRGEATNGNGNHYGIYGIANSSATSGIHYGIYGTASGGATNWGLYTPNNAYVGGTLDLGAGASDDLTAADVTDLTDGGQTALHTHAFDTTSGDARYLRSDVADTAAGIIAFNGGTSGSTAPFTVDSYTTVTNLSADYLDGYSEAAFFRLANDETVSGVPAFNGGTASAAPFSVDSTFLVTNLNADLLDGQHEASFFKLADDETVSGTTTFAAATTDIRGEIVDGDSTYVTIGEDAYVSGGHLGVGTLPVSNAALKIDTTSNSTANTQQAISAIWEATAESGVPQYIRGGYFEGNHSGPANDSRVYGVQASAFGAADSTGTHYGVSGFASGGNGLHYGVIGSASGGTGGHYGVAGFAGDNSDTGARYGVYGEALSAAGGYISYGVCGIGGMAGGYFYDSDSSVSTRVAYGTYKAYSTGTNSFVQNHPYEKDKVVVYASPEGDEVATYTRGTARLVDGLASVKLGETFKWVTNADVGLTAHLTPKGSWGDLYVESLTPGEMVVRSAGGDPQAAFDFIVYGLRIGFEEISIVQNKQEESWIPSMRDHRALYEDKPELRAFNALERFKGMESGAGLRKTFDMSSSQALKESIHEFDPAVDRIRTGGDPSHPAVKSSSRTAEPARVQRVVPVATSRSEVSLEAPSARTQQETAAVAPPVLPRADRFPICEPVQEGDVLTNAPEHPGAFCLTKVMNDPGVVGIVMAEAVGAPSAKARSESAPSYDSAPVATSGIVLCKADSTLGPIAANDLLVASPIPGHAMKAARPIEPGTVIGKALEPLESGTGMIKVLVMLR
jgi:hypothetical protein